jgi:nucleotide-binding universal stress UspA family protein
MTTVIWAIDPYQSGASELSKDAFRLAAWLGHSGRASIQPVFVLTSGVRPMPSGYFRKLLPDLKEEATKKLAELHASWKGLPISDPKLLIEPSDHVENVGEALLDYAEAENADLVVLRTHGRKGLGRFFLGSLSETLVKRARIPVLVLPSHRALREIERRAEVLGPRIARIHSRVEQAA